MSNKRLSNKLKRVMATGLMLALQTAFAGNITPNTDMNGMQPMELMYGNPAQIPRNMMYGQPQNMMNPRMMQDMMPAAPMTMPEQAGEQMRQAVQQQQPQSMSYRQHHQACSQHKEMKQKRMAMKQMQMKQMKQHMLSVEKHLGNIEELLRQLLVEIRD